jgi:hypothetical protein
MKKIFTLIIGIVFSIMILNSQVAPPQAFSFKATIQGANGQTVVNKTISLRISILQDDMNGFTAYSEYFTPTTNHYSQVDVEIGRGDVLSGIFSSIDWSAHEYYLKVEVDAKGGTNYQLLSVTQLLSVPYALYAGSAGNAFSGNYSDLIGAPILAVVATTGNYNDLINQPTLFSGNYNDLINLPYLFSGNYDNLSNKPTLFDGTWSSLTGKPALSAIAISGSWNDLIDKPSTLTGFGISDAMSTSHPANGITAIDITNWNSAFSWGNHATAGYLKSFTELDPVFSANFDFTGAVTNDLLKFNGSKWVKFTPDYLTSFAELDPAVTNNFDFTGAVTNDLLKFNGSKWVKFTPDYLTSFAELDPAVTNNFDFTGAVTNDLLKFNGSKWVKFTPDFALTNHSHSDATTSISGFMSGTDKTKLNGLQNADGSETKVTAGTNVTVTGVGTAVSPYVIYSTGGGSISSHTIGESYCGGIVFYVYDNGQHGLIAATGDQSTGIGIRWYGGSFTNTRARANGVGAGLKNTAIIIANQGPVDGNAFAATVCNEYSVTVGGVTYGDWYLPSKYELLLLYLQKSVVGGFANDFYWSSTEFNDDYAYTSAWSLHFGNGGQSGDTKSNPNYVRAVRTF